MPEALLRTKLFVPPLRPNLVPRPRLLSRLAPSAHPSRRLTLISAPAGFGKTTLVTEWLDVLAKDGHPAQQPPLKTAWLSIDEEDNDLPRFLAHFVAALAQAVGGELPLPKTQAALQTLRPAFTERFLTSLINEIAAVELRIILVLDDYHQIEARPVHDALGFLLEHLPPQLHLLLATRVDPPLPLSRLRASGQLGELRAADLRFTASEAADFLNRVMALSLSSADIAMLESRTEGWIAGLQLAAISLQGQPNTARLIQSFAGSHRYVLDYLVEEVLNQQPPRLQAFLLQTAILERLTGPLCDAVTGQNSGQQTLAHLDAANLFLVPLDGERYWYRYHHLFADVLRARLRQQQPDRLPTLHRRASAWYDAQGLPSAAIRHALAAGDFPRAADLAELSWPDWSESLQSIAWLNLVKSLPDDVVRARPVLCVLLAQAHLSAGELEAAEARLQDAERWLAPPAGTRRAAQEPDPGMIVVSEAHFQTLPAAHAMARAYLAQATDDVPNTLYHTRRLLDALPPDDNHPWRDGAAALLGLAYWTSGDVDAAERALTAGLTSDDPSLIQGAFLLAEVRLARGRLREALAVCEQAVQVALGYGDMMPMGTEDIYSGISRLYRELDQLPQAAEALALSEKYGEQVGLPDWRHRWCKAQAELQLTRGDFAGALAALEEAQRAYVRTPIPQVRPIAALKARVWLAQGDTDAVFSWAAEHGLTAGDELSYMREFEHLTLARALIAHAQNGTHDGSLAQAQALLDRLQEAAQESGRTGSLIDILLLQALGHEKRGDLNAALAPLETALTLAGPQGYVRTFVDEGPPMARLLREARARGIAPDAVRPLLAAFPETAGVGVALAAPGTPPEADWLEPLSERELEVLQLIANGLTNGEIADRLYLSLNTVKVHTRNIYSKLDVHHRTQAVARARALGILPAA